MNSYLKVAEAVLRQSRQPLSAPEILEAAVRLQMLPEHLYGRTQSKTLQARLSEDLLHNKRNTTFARTSPGRFTLRSKLQKADGKSSDEYLAPLRSYQLKQFEVLCADRNELNRVWLENRSIVEFNKIAGVFSRQIPLLIAECDANLVHLRVLVMIRNLHRTLTLTALPNSGFGTRRTLGLLGYVMGSDADLFSREPVGLNVATRRIISEQSTAPAEYVETLNAQTSIDSVKCVWLFGDHESSKGLAVLTTIECRDPELFISYIPDHRSPRWTELPSEINDLENLEPLSRCLLSEVL